VEEPLLQKVAV